MLYEETVRMYLIYVVLDFVPGNIFTALAPSVDEPPLLTVVESVILRK